MQLLDYINLVNMMYAQVHTLQNLRESWGKGDPTIHVMLLLRSQGCDSLGDEVATGLHNLGVMEVQHVASLASLHADTKSIKGSKNAFSTAAC